MIQLEDLPLTTRLWILVLTVLGTVTLLLIAHDAEGQPGIHPAYAERIIQLDRDAIESAYVEHVKKLFSVWVTDYSEEPPRALKSMANARNAYSRAMRDIDKREQELGGKQP